MPSITPADLISLRRELADYGHKSGVHEGHGSESKSTALLRIADTKVRTFLGRPEDGGAATDASLMVYCVHEINRLRVLGKLPSRETATAAWWWCDAPECEREWSRAQRAA